MTVNDPRQDRLRRDRAFWESHAKHDPLWAVLSDPTRKGRQWDTRQFFETGRREISLLLHDLDRLGHPPRRGRALDFGCGVGRLTQALADHFGEAVGIDISPTMIALARRLNTRPDIAKYIEYGGGSLLESVQGPFDLVYSDIVLQHVEPEIAIEYVDSFVKLLGAGGVAVFQLPSQRRPPEASAAAPVAMPPGAYQHRIELQWPLPAVMAPGDTHLLECSVTNAGTVTWRQHAHGSIRFGNHWLNAATLDMLVQDDGRVALPSSLAPGESVRVELCVTSPPTPGDFVCELDLVHEGISWFGDKGARTVRTRVAVRPEAPPAEGATAATMVTATGRVGPAVPALDVYSLLPGTDEEPGDFPMHGIPFGDVVWRVEAAGARLVHAEVDDRGGKEWEGYRYFVAR